VATFLMVAGTPAEVVERMKQAPVRGWFTGLEHTLPYDLAICDPGAHPRTENLAKIAIPTLVIGGGASPEALQAGARVAGGEIDGLASWRDGRHAFGHVYQLVREMYQLIRPVSNAYAKMPWTNHSPSSTP